jgi:hypothetical protein
MAAASRLSTDSTRTHKTAAGPRTRTTPTSLEARPLPPAEQMRPKQRPAVNSADRLPANTAAQTSRRGHRACSTWRAHGRTGSRRPGAERCVEGNHAEAIDRPARSVRGWIGLADVESRPYYTLTLAGFTRRGAGEDTGVGWVFVKQAASALHVRPLQVRGIRSPPQ